MSSGLPLKQVNEATQFKTFLKLLIADDPELRFIVIRNNNPLDHISMAEVIGVAPEGFSIHLQGTLPPGSLPNLSAVELTQDLRGFLSEIQQGSMIFTDGFESGDVTVWSNSVP